MRKPPRLTQIRRNFLPKLSKDTFGIQSDNFDSKHFDEVNQFIEENYKYFYPPEDRNDYIDDDHGLWPILTQIHSLGYLSFLSKIKPEAPATYTMTFLS